MVNANWFRGFQGVSLSVEDTLKIVYQISASLDSIVGMLGNSYYRSPEARFVTARNHISWIVRNMQKEGLVDYIPFAEEISIITQAAEAIKSYAENPTATTEPEVF